MSEKQLCTVHLRLKGMSGRAVRYRLLDPDEVDRAETLVAQAAPKDITGAEFNRKVVQQALEMMIDSYSDPVTKEQLAKAKFKKPTPGALLESWGAVFTTKDTIVLRRIYFEECTVSKEDLDTIMGERVTALAD